MSTVRRLVFLFVSLFALPLLATTYLVPTDAELIERADAIAVVTGMSSRVIEKGSGGFVTEYQLQVDAVLKGTLAEGQLVNVVEPGGAMNGRAMAVAGAPVYTEGETSLVFLQKYDGEWRTWGLGLGKFDRVRGGDQGFLLRGLDGHEIIGFDENGRAHIENARLEEPFLDFVRGRIRGEAVSANYTGSGEANMAARTAAKSIEADAAPGTLAYLLPPANGRWSTGAKSFLVNDNGMSSSLGGRTIASNAMAVWRNDPTSDMNPTVGGGTTLSANRCVGTSCSGDGTSVIVFNVNLSSLGSGVVGYTSIYTGGPQNPHRGQLINTLTEADVEIASTLTTDSLRQGVLAHEMGHAFGFRHSDCNSNPCSSNALMKALNNGSALGPWDRLAASTVYSGGAIQCPTTVISSQPTVRSGVVSGTAIVSVGISGDVLPASYQFYEGASGDTSNPVSGGSGTTTSTSAAISVTSTATPRSYWVRLTNGCDNSQNSNAVTVGGGGGCTEPAITTQPQNKSITAGQTATLSVTATGTAPLTYLWKEQGLFGNSPAPGINNQTTYTTPALNTTTRYLVEVSNSCGTATSSLVTVTVGDVPCTPPAIVSGPSSLVIPLGGSATFSVNASGTAPLSYQWYLGQRGDDSNPIAGATSADYNTGPLTSARTVWVRVTNGCGSADSPSATAEVSCSLAAPFLSAPSVVNSGVQYTVSFGPSAGALSYEIQESTTADFANPVTRTETGTTTTFIHSVAPPNPVAYYYRARAIVSCLGINTPSAFSNSARTVVNPPAVPAAPPLTGIDVAIPLGSTGTPVQFQFVLLPPAGTTNPAFTAVTDVPFLSVSPSQGTVPAGGITLTVTASAGGLPEGTSTGTVIVTFTTPKTAGPLGSSTASTPVNVSAVSAAAPTPKSASPPDNAMIIPAVAHADGIGAQFVSDVRIANTFTQSLKYRLTYTPSNSNGLLQGQQTTITVGPGGTIALNDIVKQWYGVGALSGEGGKGVLEIRPESYTGKIDEDARSAYTTVATSRTYAKTPTGTLGQFIPGIPYVRFVGKTTDPNRPTTLSLQQIAQSSAYRTNLGLVEASGQPATVRIRVYNSDGQQVGGDFTESLQAGEFKQLDQYLANKGITLNDGRIQVDVTSDTGRITAYASVLDNVTADPMLIEATRILDTRSRRFVVPGLADAKGNGANWQSDVRVFNPTTGAIAFNMTFYPQGNPGGAITRTRTANPGQVVVLDNILQSTFGTSGAGAVHVETATESPLIVTARTYDQRPSGTYGQFIPAVTSADAVGAGERALQILQVEHSDRFRTNVGLVEVSGQPVTVKITAIIPQRSTAPVFTRQLAANETVQFNGLLPNFMNVQGAAYNARLVIEVVGGSGRVAGYASVIDNATQDPTYVPAQ